MSKINSDNLRKNIIEMLKGKKKEKRKNPESIDLQIALRDYDPEKDKRFSGSIKLPNPPHQKMKVCIIGTAAHCEEAKKAEVSCIDIEGLKKFNKEKKPIKKWSNPQQVLLCSESLMKQLPRLLGNVLVKSGKFPLSMGENENIAEKVKEMKSIVKFQLKKEICLGTRIGVDTMDVEPLRQNITMAVNFLVSLLKKGWQNVRSIIIKTTFGKPVRVYG